MNQTKAAGPVVLINVFTPRPGKLDEFVALQTAALEQFRGRIAGWRGGRLHRALDGSSAVMMSVFDAVESHQKFVDSALFAEHRDRILPLVERVEPRFYEIVAESGVL